MALEHPGSKDGIIYTKTAEPTYSILTNQICSAIIVVGCISLFVCHFGRSIYTCKKIRMENRVNGVCDGSEDTESIFPSKSSKDKLGILYYYIYFNHTLTFLALLVGIILAVHIAVYYIFDIYLIIGCNIALRLSAFSYQFVRYAIYWIGILRILITFHGLAFDYSKTFKRVLLIYMLLSNIYVLVTHVVFSIGYDIYSNDRHWCQYGVHIIASTIGFFVEISTNVLLLMVFIKPLILLSKNLESTSENVLKALTKVSVLMIIGILTSFIYLAISIYPLFSGYNYIDTFINLVCIVLMNKINAKDYHKTCNCCHKMMYKICTHCVRKKTSTSDANNIDSTTGNSAQI